MSDSVNIKRLHGQQGEQLASEWLVDNGFNILHANWRSGRYELDLVARDEQGDLRIVEVKTRRAGALTSPEEAFTRAKFRSLCSAANAYIALYDLDLDTHFDLIAIDLHEAGEHSLRYIPDVMTPQW